MLWLEFGQFTLFWLFTALLFPLEINLRNKKKILVIGFCKPPSLNDAYFMDQLPGALSFCTTIYDNFLLLGDFNISHDDERLKEFCNSFSLGHLIKKPNCYMVTIILFPLIILLQL